MKIRQIITLLIQIKSEEGNIKCRTFIDSADEDKDICSCHIKEDPETGKKYVFIR